MLQPDIYVVGAVRTAIGTFGGALKDISLADLATTAVRAVLERSSYRPRKSAMSSWAT